MAKYNKNIQKFIEDNNINLSYFKKNKQAILFNKVDLNPIVTKWGMYKEEEKVKITISNVIGKSMNTSKNILLELNELFDETADEYQKRSITMLDYNKDNIIDNLQKSFLKEPITLTEINRGKYVVRDNGMHRCSLIRTHYLNELSRCKELNKIKEIENKYTITAFLENLDLVKTYSSYIFSLLNKNVTLEEELDNNYKKTGKIVLNYENGKKNILNDNELIEYLKGNMRDIPNSDLKNNLIKLSKKDDHFKEFVKENLNEITTINI